MSGDLMKSEMAEQPQVLAGLVDRSGELIAAVREVVPQPLRGIVFVARGSSDNAAVLGRYACELTAGRPAGLAAPSLHTRYAARVDYRGQLVVGLSQSGATPEVVSTCERLREAGARVAAITNDDASPLARVGHVTLSTAAGAERAVPATKTVTAQMLLVLLLAAALGEAPYGAADLRALPAAIAEVIADPEPVQALAESWAEHRRLLVVTRGLLYAAALETALKIRETAGVHAQGISSADLLHGPIASLDSELPVLLLRGGAMTATELAGLADRLCDLGVPLAAFGRTSSARRPDAGLARTVSLPLELPEGLQALTATVRGQQLSLAWSLACGLDPDSPPGLSKVTPTR